MFLELEKFNFVVLTLKEKMEKIIVGMLMISRVKRAEWGLAPIMK
jgi:hypothetical protein